MIFFGYRSKCVRLTGRWYKEENTAISTACGSKIEFTFNGDMAIIHFDTMFSRQPYPHIWISVDGGAKIEAALEPFVRIKTVSSCKHFVVVEYKSSVETHHRWFEPLDGKIAFKGFEAEEADELEPVTRTYIEFIGDSITEGVLVDEKYKFYKTCDYDNRVFQDDATATYAYLTAHALGLEPLIMGYGAVGLTRAGKGSVPKAADSYLYCYNGKRTDMPEPEYIVINHGANDTGGTVDNYLKEYDIFLDIVHKKHPHAKIIVLGAFCGWCCDELFDFIADYNKRKNTDVLYINTKNWVPPEPLHPGREGHKAIAEQLVEHLKSIMD